VHGVVVVEVEGLVGIVVVHGVVIVVVLVVGTNFIDYR